MQAVSPLNSTFLRIYYLQLLYYFQLNNILKVREGRRAANFPELCGFLDFTAISEDI